MSIWDRNDKVQYYVRKKNKGRRDGDEEMSETCYTRFGNKERMGRVIFVTQRNGRRVNGYHHRHDLQDRTG
jgi:hypothetical protein